MFAYGPVMLHEALAAAEWLDREGLSIAVVNQPWLNVVDPAWLAECVGPYSTLVVIEDHGPVGALGDHLGRALVAHGLLEGRQYHVFGVEGLPACGTPAEALQAHGLDAASLASRITALVGRPRALAGEPARA